MLKKVMKKIKKMIKKMIIWINEVKKIKINNSMKMKNHNKINKILAQV